MIPHFEPGGQVTAQQLNELVARLRALQKQVLAVGTDPPKGNFFTRRRIDDAEAFHYAFEVQNRGGKLCYVQGYVEMGPGRFVAVGAPGWNELGPFAEDAEVWLDCTGETPEVRLGGGSPSRLCVCLARVVRAGEGRFYPVQLAGGLWPLCAPVTALGAARKETGREYVAEGGATLGHYDAAEALCSAGGVAGTQGTFTLGYQVNLHERTLCPEFTQTAPRYMQVGWVEP